MTSVTPPTPRIHPDLAPLLRRVHHADAFAFLPRLPESSVHAVVTDPPFGLGFLGQLWDEFPDGPTGYQAWVTAWARLCLRVLLPGGHLVAFGGNRTVHRLAAGLEDAGFEVRGLLGWIHAQGIPKQRGQLRPALEPIVLARKPFPGPAIRCFATHGTGLLNVEACRFPFADAADATAGFWPGRASTSPRELSWYRTWKGGTRRDPAGRWPGTALVTSAALGARSRYFDADRWSQAVFGKKEKRRGRTHPTVKPEAVVAWLVSLVSWPGQVVLDPFAGSGTTVRVAEHLGRRSLGVEVDGRFANAYRTSRHDRRSHPSSAASSTTKQRPKSRDRC